MCQTKLPYPPQTLKLRRINQANKQLPLIIISFEANYIMN
jgi:hypothetical protein